MNLNRSLVATESARVRTVPADNWRVFHKGVAAETNPSMEDGSIVPLSVHPCCRNNRGMPQRSLVHYGTPVKSLSGGGREGESIESTYAEGVFRRFASRSRDRDSDPCMRMLRMQSAAGKQWQGEASIRGTRGLESCVSEKRIERFLPDFSLSSLDLDLDPSFAPSPLPFQLISTWPEVKTAGRQRKRLTDRSPGSPGA